MICSANQWTGFYIIGTSVMKVLKKDDLCRFARNERPMWKWILNFWAEDTTTTHMLNHKLYLPTLSSTIRSSCLRWFGHIERSTNWINKIQRRSLVTFQQAEKSWNKLITDDLLSCNITSELIKNLVKNIIAKNYGIGKSIVEWKVTITGW